MASSSRSRRMLGHSLLPSSSLQPLTCSGLSSSLSSSDGRAPLMAFGWAACSSSCHPAACHPTIALHRPPTSFWLLLLGTSACNADAAGSPAIALPGCSSGLDWAAPGCAGAPVPLEEQPCTLVQGMQPQDGSAGVCGSFLCAFGAARQRPAQLDHGHPAHTGWLAGHAQASASQLARSCSMAGNRQGPGELALSCTVLHSRPSEPVRAQDKVAPPLQRPTLQAGGTKSVSEDPLEHWPGRSRQPKNGPQAG